MAKKAKSSFYVYIEQINAQRYLALGATVVEAEENALRQWRRENYPVIKSVKQLVKVEFE